MEEEPGWWEESSSDVVEPKPKAKAKPKPKAKPKAKPIQHISEDPASVRNKPREDDEDKWDIGDIGATVVILIIVAIDWIFLDGALTWFFL